VSNLRRWQFDSTSPVSLQIAADTRLSQTDYTDDQSWELLLGSGESPALALQTYYGGRVGLASIVPMWLHDGRVIYQAQAYAKPPYVTAFAPGYIRVQATLSLQLALQAEYWVMESHAVGARYTLANAHSEPVEVRLDLLGFVGSGGKEQKTSLISTSKNMPVLSMGQAGNIYPVVALEGAALSPDDSPASAKIGRNVTIPGRKKVVLRWVHAGLPDVKQSAALAQKWLDQDWEAAFKQLFTAAQAIPDIETGNADWDAAIAFSYQQMIQSFLRPTTSLPYASFVSVRQPSNGFNPHPGSDHDRGWSGQTPTQAYLAALAVASTNPSLAEGVIRNYLAVQQPDGWIDWRPGLGGQKQGLLCLPILARMSWGIFQYTDDDAFLREVFPGLLKFFERWLQPDLDVDNDGIPEWQSEYQTGYAFFPTFAGWQDWGQGADIRLVETPDLAAYLLSEAKSLREIAFYLRNEQTQAQLDEHISRLQSALESLWDDNGNRYVYRDRDTHLTTGSTIIVQDARGGDELILAEKISPANRLIVRVTGGVNLTPRMTMRLTGFDQNGAETVEEVSSNTFVWVRGHGSYTSQRVFSQIDKISFEGLSRVYRIDVQTVDTTRLDINALLPLWSAGIPDDRASAIISLVTNPEHFWRVNGVTMCSALDPNFDPSNANGSGSVWPFWFTLMAEGLIEYGELSAAYEAFKRLLDTQTSVLREQKAFSEFYHSDEAKGLGSRGSASGVVPLHLLLRLTGIRIINTSKVWVGGKFVWEQPIILKQHEVRVRRTAEETTIEFPSGYQVTVQGDEWQEVVDPNPVEAPSKPPTLAHFDDLEPEAD
jgi:hypothetical protein